MLKLHQGNAFWHWEQLKSKIKGLVLKIYHQIIREQKMAEKIKIDLGPVQKTMFLPLFARAAETLKAKPALVDTTAVDIVNSIDYDFSLIQGKVQNLSHAAMVMRSLYIDNTVKKFLQRHPGAVVVNIGCGMDTTFERVDNGLLRWFDLDLADTMELRRKFLRESQRRTFITSSFLEPAWLDILKPTDGIFFISAGVFRYFEEKQIQDFISLIATRFPDGELVFDASSPGGIKAANQGVMKDSGLDRKASLMKWGLVAKDAQKVLGEKVEILEIDTFQKNSGMKFSLFEKAMMAVNSALCLNYMVHVKFVKA
jgi:O-methyltransferase involved in polyketide biosynthesis